MRALDLMAVAGAVGLAPMGNQAVREDGRAPELLVLDVLGNGFCFGSVAQGVALRFGRPGRPVRTSWACSNSDDAFVGLDRDRDGRIDGAYEILGGMVGPPNGLDALSARLGLVRPQDRTQPQWVTATQPGFGELILWTDRNGNGVSEEPELRSAVFAGVTRINLAGRPASRIDQ